MNLLQHFEERWWVQLVIVGSAFVLALRTLWYKALKPVWQAFSEALQHVKILSTIAHEFHPNSGTSLRDAVDRIESTLQEHLQLDANNMNEIYAQLSEVGNILKNES